MPHELHRLIGSIYNSPHLILESALHPVIDYLNARNNSLVQLTTLPQAREVAPPMPKQVANFGEILIDGTLTHRPISGLCGPSGTSYQGILGQCAELIDAGVDIIVLTHSSPGGQAQMAFDCATSIREMCDEANVQLISYVETMSASASYLIACVSDEVICHPEAVVGSIGAMIAIVDRSKAMADAGLKPVYLSSTPGKIPFDSSGGFSEKFLSKMQDEVTLLGNQFAAHVSKYTGVALEDIKALDAEMFHAEEAKTIGLVNSVMTQKQFVNYLINKPKGAPDA